MSTDEEKAILFAQKLAGEMIIKRMAELDDLIARLRKEKEFLRNLASVLGASPLAKDKEPVKGKICPNPKCGKENPPHTARCLYCKGALN